MCHSHNVNTAELRRILKNLNTLHTIGPIFPTAILRYGCVVFSAEQVQSPETAATRHREPEPVFLNVVSLCWCDASPGTNLLSAGLF